MDVGIVASAVAVGVGAITLAGAFWRLIVRPVHGLIRRVDRVCEFVEGVPAAHGYPAIPSIAEQLAHLSDGMTRINSEWTPNGRKAVEKLDDVVIAVNEMRSMVVDHEAELTRAKHERDGIRQEVAELRGTVNAVLSRRRRDDND